VSAGAIFEPLGDGGGRIVTPRGQWHNAVGFPLAGEAAESGVLALVACRRGEVGVGVLSEDGSRYLVPERSVATGETRLVNALSDRESDRAGWLMIRNWADDETASECELLGVFAGGPPTVELTEGDVALALRNPVAAHESCAARVWPNDVITAVGPQAVPLRVQRPRPPLSIPPARMLWAGAMESLILGAAQDLIGLLDEFEPAALEPHVAVLEPHAMRAYLGMNVVRVVRLVDLLRRRGVESGEVLEVGAWFGSFALALRRLGYGVVACDRYASYGNAFNSHVALLRREGVRIVSTTREGELDQIGGLGQFDVVLAAAVIEHVPHTPRHLLETLFRAVRPGGLLVLDTPNVARYWNRRALERGETVFQPLEDQYSCEPPWEGHHREYVARELGWMLDQVGCADVEVGFLDYNMLQYDQLSEEHIECLASIIEDPSQSDILLAAGRRPAD
jgi:2-polyprenyl-3-methyl-5-hydroxy-6-metoxy-1,4-benzoquinol methylase